MKTISSIKIVPTDSLIPYARNSRTHSEQQVAQLAASIKEFGFNNPILIKEDGTVIAGHGRLAAAIKLGLKEVPTICLSHLNQTQVKAYVLADNKLALNAGWDEGMLALELQEIGEQNFDISTIGFSEDEADKLMKMFLEDEVGIQESSDEDKSTFQQKTFILHNEQFEEVNEAISKAKELGKGQSAVNENTNGNALAFICYTFNRMKNEVSI